MAPAPTRCGVEDAEGARALFRFDQSTARSHKGARTRCHLARMPRTGTDDQEPLPAAHGRIRRIKAPPASAISVRNTVPMKADLYPDEGADQLDRPPPVKTMR